MRWLHSQHEHGRYPGTEPPGQIPDPGYVKSHLRRYRYAKCSIHSTVCSPWSGRNVLHSRELGHVLKHLQDSSVEIWPNSKTSGCTMKLVWSATVQITWADYKISLLFLRTLFLMLCRYWPVLNIRLEAEVQSVIRTMIHRKICKARQILAFNSFDKAGCAQVDTWAPVRKRPSDNNGRWFPPLPLLWSLLLIKRLGN